VFVELMPLLKERTLLLTIAQVGGKVKVNVIPAKAKEGEDQALTTCVDTRKGRAAIAKCAEDGSEVDYWLAGFWATTPTAGNLFWENH
jgi:hypothetical protein